MALNDVFAFVNQRNGHRRGNKTRVLLVTFEAKPGYALNPLAALRVGSFVTFEALGIIAAGLRKVPFLFMALGTKIASLSGRRRFGSDFLAMSPLVVRIMARDAVGIVHGSFGRFACVQAFFKVASYTCPVMALEAGLDLEKIASVSIDLSRIGMARSLDHIRVTILAGKPAVSRNMVPDRVHKPRVVPAALLCNAKGRDSKQDKSETGSHKAGKTTPSL